MPLNKLQNFIRNTDGRTLYVNPNDLDSTDSILNDGTSLTQPFKTIQRALLESARFSYVKGSNNDIVEKTTILIFPGEHVVDNRPGWGIRNANGTARAFPPSGSGGNSDPIASSVLSLELDSNFDLTQEDNILYKFNSLYGGVIVPRGTSIVGLDLRKTKIRPKYVPNPTDDSIKKSSIFRVTGACYFWQFSMFDGDDTGLVYTHPYFFTSDYQSTPLFSHHKLTCFEYADGVNEFENYGLTDLDMYYSKLSNAYNSYRPIPVSGKFPAKPEDFAKKEPEWKIVGAFESDPVGITTIISGNGQTANNLITVTTEEEHNLDVGTPIKIRGVEEETYNISTKVASVDPDNPRIFTYLLPDFPDNLNPRPGSGGSTVTVETDTVSGASPYIFNCSLRSVWGMNGMFADGSKASGFRSMVVAQFTAVSLQKDDRAFVKYDPVSRSYNGVSYTPVYGSALPAGASQTNSARIYHLDPRAIYRKGWESSHIKIANDAFIQIVSVFAIGFNKHFDVESGGDASITNSNSNFGQISLNSDGFKAAAFDKDNNAFITSIIPPRDFELVEEDIEWLSVDVGLTTSAGISTHLYLYGFNAEDSLPVSLTQGYRVGARVSDKLYLNINDTEYSANILMQDGITSSYKLYNVTNIDTSTFILTIGSHSLQTGEKIIINSESGDLPENVIPHTVYYAVRVNSTQIKIASSYTNALNGDIVKIYGGTQVKIYSRVSDKNSGDIGSPIQFDESRNNWYITVNSGNSIYSQLVSLANSNSLVGLGLTETTDLTYVKRIVDNRSLDEKIYKIRVVIPKELQGAKDPQTGFIIQESSSTGVGDTADFTRTFITKDNYDYNKNPRFITTCTAASEVVTVLTDFPHDLHVGDIVVIKNVKDSSNPTGKYNLGYNGKFKVIALGDSGGNNPDTYFRYSTEDVNGVLHTPNAVSSNNTDIRTIDLPRFEKNDLQSNLYVYRNEVISPYIEDSQDGIYHLYVLNANNPITEEFTHLQYSQSPVDLYPQLDRDNPEANPPSAKTFALRSPIGDTNTSDLKKSITRETIDKTIKSFGIGNNISVVSSSTNSATLTFDRNHGLGGVTQGVLNVPNSSYIPGTYYNVKLLSGSPSGTWKGATAKVVVNSGQNITSITLIASGSGYTLNEVLYPDPSRVGTGDGEGKYTITSISGISRNIGDVVQVTGIGTANDGYYRISQINSSNQISIAKTGGDPTPISGQYALIIGPSSQINSTNYNGTTKITSFTTSTPHGLLVGNKFRVIDSSNNNLGDYVVEEKISSTSFTAVGNISAFGGFILKHGLSANEGISDIRTESFGSRQISFYDNEYLQLSTTLNDSSDVNVQFSWISTGIGTDIRFPMGSYIQIDDELMRITSTNNSTQFQVVRGVLGTRKQSHSSGSLIRKINPIPIEFRRPSILRASGHTFEYLGYGPGNYSTGLPQVQVKSLTEREDFLVQAQERSCGAVIYTGMNSSGDFFSGNTKTSSVSGEITSYDIPKSTVTGQDTSKSSVVFDEVTIKEKLLVEGGDSGTVLSQFDGPVTFNKQTRFKNTSTFSGNVRITNNTGSDSTTKGALTVKGGVGIGSDLYVGGKLNINGGLKSSGSTNGNIQIAITNDNTIDTSIGGLTLNATVGNSVGISTNTTISGTATISGLLDANGGAEIDNIRIGVANNNTIDTSSGNLTVSAATGSSVSISTNTTISGTATISGTTTINGLLDANDGAEIDNIQINNNTIDTSTGDLVLDSFSNKTTINTNLDVSGFLDVNDGATIDNVQINNNTIDTSSGGLILNATGGNTVGINTNTIVTGNLTVNSGTITGNLTNSISAGNGLSAGGSFNNSANVTLSLGTPSDITSSSTNSSSSGTHSHLLANGAVTASKLDGGQTGSAPIYGVRAWGKVNGNSGVPNNEKIISGGNIQDFDRISQGEYRVYFTVDMPNNDYAVIATPFGNSTESQEELIKVDTLSSSSFKLYVKNANNNYVDTVLSFIVIY